MLLLRTPIRRGPPAAPNYTQCKRSGQGGEIPRFSITWKAIGRAQSPDAVAVLLEGLASERGLGEQTSRRSAFSRHRAASGSKMIRRRVRVA